MARWLERLQQYDFEIQHQPGPRHGNADALSRRPCGVCKHCAQAETKGAEDQYEILHIETENSNLKEEQHNDPTLAKVIKWLDEGQRPSKENILQESPDVKSFWSMFQQLKMCTGILTRVWEEESGEEKLLPVIPRKLVPEIFKLRAEDI